MYDEASGKLRYLDPKTGTVSIPLRPATPKTPWVAG